MVCQVRVSPQHQHSYLKNYLPLISTINFSLTSSDNPLFINTPAINSLSSDEESEDFTSKVISLYSNFVEEYKEKQSVVIIESLIYQGIVSVALFKGMKENKVKDLAKRIFEIMNGMNPEFVFYVQVDAEM